jgi:hypothetical protein
VITFDPEKHEYRRDGIITPGPTQILTEAGYINKRFYKPGKAQRGKDIHDATEKMDLFGIEPESFDASIFPFLMAWRVWKNWSECEIVATEKIIDCPELDYSGTLDRIIKWKGKPYILDIKAGVKADWHRLQIAAYGRAEDIPRGLVLYLRENGTFQTWVREEEDFQIDLYEWEQIARRRLKNE